MDAAGFREEYIRISVRRLLERFAIETTTEINDLVRIFAVSKREVEGHFYDEVHNLQVKRGKRQNYTQAWLSRLLATESRNEHK